MIILGIDPGAHGALAMLSTADRALVSVEDMPGVRRKVGRSERIRVSVPALFSAISTCAVIGCDLVIVEDVQGRGNQTGGSQLSYNVGLLHMACEAAGLKWQPVTPAQWKRRFRLGADKRAAVDMALRQWPDQRQYFLGPRGGFLDGRAEAALLAQWGAEKFA